MKDFILIYLEAMKEKLNKEWHLKNKMPKNATFIQRVQWHLAHQE